MRILFLGYAVSENIVSDLSGASVAGNKMQLNVLHNLKNYVEELQVMTIYPIAVWPDDKTLRIKRKEMDIGCGIKSIRISFWNFPIMKQISQICSMYREARNYLKKHPETVVMTYNMYPQVGLPAIRLRKYSKQVIPLLADPPIDDTHYCKGSKKFLQKIYNGAARKSLQKVEKLIVLNKHARDLFAPGKKYLLIDGGINVEEYRDYREDKLKHHAIKNIVYGGALTEYSGVRELIGAMELVKDPKIVLDIYGDGPLRNFVQNKTSEKIRYYGRVTNKEMLKIQRDAWLLCNPRPINDPIACVTFPSKIFEYMMSGTPVLATRLNGFTEEYKDKLFLAEDNSPQELSMWINRINQMDETQLAEMSMKARDFMIATRSWEIQVRKIVDFVED